jgi:hypothetical protein
MIYLKRYGACLKMAYGIEVFKNTLYELNSLFKKVQKRVQMKDTISTQEFQLNLRRDKKIHSNR